MTKRRVNGDAVFLMHTAQKIGVREVSQWGINPENAPSLCGTSHALGHGFERPVAEMGHLLRLRQTGFTFAQISRNLIGKRDRSAAR
jgi:hypothetical protein